LDDPALDALCGPELPFADLPQALPGLLETPPGQDAPLCPVIVYSPAWSRQAP
jgi:hypothetical protein